MRSPRPVMGAAACVVVAWAVAVAAATFVSGRVEDPTQWAGLGLGGS